MSYVLSANTPPPIVIHLDSRTGEQLQTGLTTNFLYISTYGNYSI